MTDEDLIDYFKTAKKRFDIGGSNIILSLPILETHQIDLIVEYLNANPEIYALAIQHNQLTKEDAQGLIKCLYLKKLYLRQEPESEIIEILYTNNNMEILISQRNIEEPISVISQIAGVTT